MQKTVALLSIGAVLGAVATLLLMPRGEPGRGLTTKADAELNSVLEGARERTAAPAAGASSLTALAAGDPKDFEPLMREALRATGSEQARQSRLVANLWALDDAEAALQFLTALPDRRQRRDLTVTVLSAWAILEPEAALFTIQGMLRSGFEFDGYEQQLLQQIARQEPLIVLDHYTELDAAIQDFGVEAAMSVLAETDPATALAYLERTDSARESEERTAAIVRGWARKDPHAALDWVQSRSPSPNRALLATVVREVAATDALEAFALVAARMSDPGSLRAALTAVMQVAAKGASTDTAAALMQTALETAARDRVQFMLVPMFEVWLEADAEIALQWLTRNSNRVPDLVFSGVANTVRQSGSNAVLAASYIDSFPPSARAALIEPISRAYAEQDPFASASWTDRFRGTPEYETAVLAVADTLTLRYPAEAIALLDRARLRSASERAILQAAVTSWSTNDPAAFARWAEGVSDPERLAMVAPRVTRARAETDPIGTANWLLQLPSSIDRDQALAEALRVEVEQSVRDARPAMLDQRLLDAFSSNVMRQQLLITLAVPIIRQDAEAARAFADRYITDPGIRQLFDQQLARKPP